MSVAYAHEPSTWDAILDVWRELDIPEGYRPEVTAEGIVMTPAPGGTHNLIADRVLRALAACTPDQLGILPTQGVGIEAATAIYIPDFTVAPRAAVPTGPDPIPAGHVLLAVEITSRSNAENDRINKLRAYAIGKIPQYLLIDPHHENGPMSLLLTRPMSSGQYGSTVAVPFGEPVSLGHPFDAKLDTTGF